MTSAFRPFPLGAIRPTGWLRNQLRIQADGLSGHLDEFWPDIKDSAWFGGSGDAWERAPYWLDGVIPLAWLLDDPALKSRITRYVQHILSGQHEDGWLGPKQEELRRHDIWSLFLALKALTQYGDATGDERVVTAVEKCLRRIELHIERAPLFNWAQFRWFEALISICWLHEKTGGAWLLDLARKLHAQGFDYIAYFESWPSREPTPKRRWSFMSHVVNNAMAVKAAGLWWRVSGQDSDRAPVYDIIEKLDRYHGMVTGVFSGDECLAGKNPVQGTELCAVVEYMYSLEVLLSVLGDPAFGDRLEKIAFNALPATFSPDMWAHQYDQQVNQVECSIKEGRSWNTNGAEANIFGLQPNYGCCTANLSQGWPKFAAHLWMRSADGGIAATAYAPSALTTEIAGTRVTVDLDTEYPFREGIRLTVSVERPVRFPLHLRIPEWSRAASLEASWEAGPVPLTASTFHSLERLWQGGERLHLRFPMRPLLLAGFRGAAALQRGPLLYSLRIGETWKRVNEDKPLREPPHADWEVHPSSPWNYAIDVRDETLESDAVFSEHPVGTVPFSPDGAPVTCRVRARKLPEWKLENGSAGLTPETPVRSSEPEEEVVLIPYGCTNLRITEFPVLEREDPPRRDIGRAAS